VTPLVEREDINAILRGVFDVNATLVEIQGELRKIRCCWRTEMKRKKKGKPPELPPEVIARHEETQRLLAERIAYHRAKIEEERAQREREAS
jgi:hypothetical protein